MKQCARIGILLAAMLFQASAASAWSVKGYVRCDANQSGQIDAGDLPLAGVTITATDGTFVGTATTDAAGYYKVSLPDLPGSYLVTIAVPAGSTLLVPAAVPVPAVLTDVIVHAYVDFLISSSACVQQACWLTGGGAKFSPIAQMLVAEKGPQHSFGGNVNPGCNPDSGDGGNWNHVAHGEKKHFQGRSIQVDRCGNVPGIPEGSESPVTPYNFIEFSGTGTMNGVSGNKTDYGPVIFRARAEDRNEPGSSGAKDGAKIDRYFLEVRDAANAVVLRISGDPNSDVPVPITDGNLQIHISSCAVQ